MRTVSMDARKLINRARRGENLKADELQRIEEYRKRERERQKMVRLRRKLARQHEAAGRISTTDLASYSTHIYHSVGSLDPALPSIPCGMLFSQPLPYCHHPHELGVAAGVAAVNTSPSLQFVNKTPDTIDIKSPNAFQYDMLCPSSDYSARSSISSTMSSSSSDSSDSSEALVSPLLTPNYTATEQPFSDYTRASTPLIPSSSSSSSSYTEVLPFSSEYQDVVSYVESQQLSLAATGGHVQAQERMAYRDMPYPEISLDSKTIQDLVRSYLRTRESSPHGDMQYGGSDLIAHACVQIVNQLNRAMFDSTRGSSERAA